MSRHERWSRVCNGKWGQGHILLTVTGSALLLPACQLLSRLRSAAHPRTWNRCRRIDTANKEPSFFLSALLRPSDHPRAPRLEQRTSRVARGGTQLPHARPAMPGILLTRTRNWAALMWHHRPPAGEALAPEFSRFIRLCLREVYGCYNHDGFFKDVLGLMMHGTIPDQQVIMLW